MKNQTSVYDNMVCAPGSLELPGETVNSGIIADWWKRAKLYAEAMDDLDRVVILKRTDEGVWYLSSVDEGLTR